VSSLPFFVGAVLAVSGWGLGLVMERGRLPQWLFPVRERWLSSFLGGWICLGLGLTTLHFPQSEPQADLRLALGLDLAWVVLLLVALNLTARLLFDLARALLVWRSR